MAFMGLMGNANAQCAWESLGPKDTNQIAFGIAEYTSVAVSPATKSTYVAFYDENYWGASVREYNAGQWSQVGSHTIVRGKTLWESMAVDKSGTPYMACQNPNKTLHCSVFQWTGSAWDTLGQSSFTNPAQYISLATDKNGVPYVAYEDLGKSDKLDVFMYNSGTMAWTPVGGSLAISQGQAQYISLAFDTVNNIPYVAFEDGKHGDKLMVYSYNGATWSTVGGIADTAGISSDTASWVSMSIDKNGHPYVAYSDASVTGGVSVMTYNGATWAAVGTASTTTGGPATYIGIGVDSVDNIYVAYADGSQYGGGGVSIVGYTASTSKWAYVGGSYKISQAISAKGAKYLTLAMDNSGSPSIVYEDGGVGDHAEMFKWNSTNKYWALQRGLGFSATSGTNNGIANYISIGVSPSSTVYAAYTDGNNASKTSVMSYSGSTWSAVGTPVSSGPSKYNQIGFDKAGDPICMFSDDYATPKYSVSAMIYKSGAWTAIGTNSNAVSGTNCYYVSMAISSSDTIYAAFQTGNYHMSVMKCAVTGSTWTNVGSADVNGDSASFESIAVDKNGVPYLAFIDNATNASGVSVMKYTAGAWQYVGMRNLDSGQAVYPSLQIDPNDNTPVVAYSQYAGSYNAHCKKWNGSQWVYIGAPGGFSEDWTDYMNLAIDKTGNYYVAYQDWGNEQINLGQRNITVEKFMPNYDTAWQVLPPSTSTSLSGSSYQALSFDPAGNLYIGYSAMSGYVKELGCPSAVNEITGNSNLVSANLYPNPNTGSFTVSVENVNEKSHIYVYNVLGQNVYTAQLTADKTEVKLNNATTGIYLYRILTDSGKVISTGKLIIK